MGNKARICSAVRGFSLDKNLVGGWWVVGWVHSALWRVGSVGEVGGAILIRGSVTLPCKMSEDVRWVVD